MSWAAMLEMKSENDVDESFNSLHTKMKFIQQVQPEPGFTSALLQNDIISTHLSEPVMLQSQKSCYKMSKRITEALMHDNEY